MIVCSVFRHNESGLYHAFWKFYILYYKLGTAINKSYHSSLLLYIMYLIIDLLETVYVPLHGITISTREPHAPSLCY